MLEHDQYYYSSIDEEMAAVIKRCERLALFIEGGVEGRQKNTERVNTTLKYMYK